MFFPHPDSHQKPTVLIAPTLFSALVAFSPCRVPPLLVPIVLGNRLPVLLGVWLISQSQPPYQPQLSLVIRTHTPHHIIISSHEAYRGMISFFSEVT